MGAPPHAPSLITPRSVIPGRRAAAISGTHSSSAAPAAISPHPTGPLLPLVGRVARQSRDGLGGRPTHRAPSSPDAVQRRSRGPIPSCGLHRHRMKPLTRPEHPLGIDWVPEVSPGPSPPDAAQRRSRGPGSPGDDGPSVGPPPRAESRAIKKAPFGTCLRAPTLARIYPTCSMRLPTTISARTGAAPENLGAIGKGWMGRVSRGTNASCCQGCLSALRRRTQGRQSAEPRDAHSCGRQHKTNRRTALPRATRCSFNKEIAVQCPVSKSNR